ncbi:serine/Threonine protein kinase and Signal Transduction Histidine Kinase with GAF and PAS/PAC sensor [Gracilibacillus boraciitolerans JCM 21714]|uniref:histidine kinase n=2 Tax=Gracilibacillus boraciitolerans TaxID=307521 RepID=W4VL64_9BACI|nr:serine/Threonine protein kinase and Signal Transduction Histidine Kinase with GAF and PAS/PAC sensor [Gracilibacillus boraciitolerans JCM 21714]
MESLDNKAILEAARIISGEVVLDKLVSKLMDIFITYAGAEHASFLIQEQQNLALVSFKHIEGKIEMYQQLKTVDESSHLSSAIIHYVVNSREAVVLNNATEEGPFIEDDYLQEVQAKSVLCLPIVHQDRLVAILYMENNKSSHVFTRERLNVLTLIASQASVSLVNAYLYAELEAKVKQRTDLLNDANQELTAVNQQLTNSKEKMKQMISNISHDLQSPVAVVQGYIGALLDGLVDDPVKQNEFLHTINYRMGSLSKLIKDLFDLSKLESGDMKFSMEAIPVDQLFDHFCQLFKLEIIQSGLQFKRRFNRDQAQEYPLLEVDVQRLEQVMANLISNAIKYATKELLKLV